MKRKIFPCVLSIVLSLSLVVPALAAPMAELVSGGSGRTTYEEHPENFYEDIRDAMGRAIEGDTVYLLKSDEADGSTTINVDDEKGQLGFANAGVTLDLDGNTLNIESSSASQVVGIAAAFHGENNVIQNGSIIIDAPKATIVGGALVQGAELNNLEISAAEGTTLTMGVGNLSGDTILTNCIIDTKDENASGMVFADQGNGSITVNSGSYIGTITEGSYKLATEESKVFSDVTDNKANGLVVTNKDTAAVVVDENGKAKLYGDLAEAVKASNGAEIVVTDEEALASLIVSEGDKLNLVDAEGNSLNEKVNLGGNLVMDANGLVSVKPSDPVVGPGTPVTPVGPWDVMDTPVANDPTVEIDDPSVPLAAGPVTRAEFIDYLWRHDGKAQAAASTFADVAEDHEYASAIGWAQANGLILGDENNNFAPDELITVAAVRVILTRYADWKEMAMPELTTLTGADSEAVLNCDEVLAEFFGE